MFASKVLCNMLRMTRVILLLLLASAFTAAGQGTGGLVYSAQGTVYEGKTGKPMEGVNVSLPDRYYATVTNADGFFTIKSDTPLSEVVFSFLGYRTLRKKADGSYMDVRLFREALPLPGARIVTGDPFEIVRAAIGSIRDNYSQSPELMECFYRETIRKRQRFTFISEATARLYKTGYNGNIGQDRTALSKSRVLLSQRRGDTLSVRVIGGPTQAITQDVVKNPDIILGEDLKYYKFEMLPPEIIDGRVQFAIKMTPAALCDWALYDGILYIDQETLSFTRVELSLDVSDPVKATRMMLVRKPLTLRFKPKEMSMTISYRRDGGVSRLEYFKSVFVFDCDWRKRLLSTQYTVVNELVVTDLYPEAVPISRSDAFRFGDSLSEKAAEFSDPDFWKEYNIIEPSESLEHAIGRLKRR